MQHSHILLLTGFLGSATLATAGDRPLPPKSPLETIPAPAPESDWEVILSMPLWATGLNGDVGIRGFDPIAIDIPIETIVDYLDFTAAVDLEVRRGRWSFLTEGIYLKMSGGGETPGELLSSVDFDYQQVIAEGAIAYRLLEGQRGYLDAVAGARYMDMSMDLDFDVSASGVDDASEAIADRIAARVAAGLRTVGDDVRDQIAGLGSGVRMSGRGGSAIDDALRDLIAARAASNVAAAKSAAIKKAEKAAERAKERLTKAIARSINEAIPNQASGSQGWVDPFVGFRGRYNLTDRFYLAGRGDIGGFGVSSELTYNLFGGIGMVLGEHWSTDLGYRYLSYDYDRAGFIYDATISGIILGFHYEF